MRIDVVSLFPERVLAVGEYGVTGRAVQKGLLTLQGWNPRDFTDDAHRTVDDRPYGGGPGMVMKVEPLRKAIGAARRQTTAPTVIYLTPKGRVLDQAAVELLAGRSSLILVAGRYEEIDQRLIDLEVDEQWSIGDYVISGGELAAMVMIDALARWLPGALGDASSAEQDSFVNGLLDCPHYTRPEEYEGMRVPDVLLSGDHAAIQRWRLQQSLKRTAEHRPDLLVERSLTEIERQLLMENSLSGAIKQGGGSSKGDLSNS